MARVSARYFAIPGLGPEGSPYPVLTHSEPPSISGPEAHDVISPKELLARQPPLISIAPSSRPETLMPTSAVQAPGPSGASLAGHCHIMHADVLYGSWLSILISQNILVACIARTCQATIAVLGPGWSKKSKTTIYAKGAQSGFRFQRLG